MRRYIPMTWILSVAFLVFSIGSSSETIVINYEGDIEGLIFEFGEPGLPIEIPGYGVFEAAYVHVVAPGREHIVITESGQFNYHADLGSGVIRGWEKVSGSGKPIGQPLEVAMQSGTLDEHFTIEGEIPEDPLDIVVPEDVDLHFKAALEYEGEPFNLQLKVKNGVVQILRP